MTRETNGNGKLAYWILGALMSLIGIISGIAHSAIMHQLTSIERRIERLEDRNAKGQ